jgi:FixJ family two-component response regulator
MIFFSVSRSNLPDGGQAAKTRLSCEGNAIVPRIPLISVVDDDASVRVAINNLVRSLGYAVRTFASAEEFLRSDHLNDTSCVIADVQMPAMSGIELQTRLRTQGCGVPFIFITAFPETSLRARALKAGALCFLAKPFDDGTLIRCLDVALANCGESGS